MQYDWGEFHDEQEGQDRKVYGFTAVLSYSRMRFITFVKRCDAPTMLRCMMEAFEYFGGLPKAALTDRMKSVFLDMDGKPPSGIRCSPISWLRLRSRLGSVGLSSHKRKARSRGASG
jgi:transposase